MSLHRVSSRPRLCSFEEFDARGDDHDSASDVSADTTESYERCLLQHLAPPPTPILSSSLDPLIPSVIALETATSMAPLKRKRSHKVAPVSLIAASAGTPKQSELQPCGEVLFHVIPPSPPEFTTSTGFSLASLPPEVRLNVLEMLDVESLRNIMLIDQEHLHLLKSSEAVEAVWKPACEQQWNIARDQTLVSRMDTAANAAAVGKENTTASTNFPFLLSLAPSSHYATDVDEALFAGTRQSTRVLRGRTVHRTHRFATQLVRSDARTVQFTGRVGVGDRCVRANAPLPRPTPLQAGGITHNVFNRFARKHPVLCHYNVEDHAVWKPFVVPFCVGNHETVDLTPRLISYFECEFLPAPATDESSPVRPPPRLLAGTRSVASECIAVGLATQHFHVHSRMPGWDRESFGFHGDDGGIFHNSGHMLSQFGARFGAGDVIGCGVDYQRQAIFYTKNGEFLGYAFPLHEHFLHRDLYPVVGIDSHCPVSCNFGIDKPFVFDLQGMIAKHQSVVLRALEHARHRHR